MVKIKVDLWKTGLHRVEIGIKKKAELMSKSRRFTKDMDIIGKVEVAGEDYGYIAYRKGLWDEKDLLGKRLVVRLFSTEITWLSGIDENLARGIALTLINEDPSPAFVVTHSGTKITYPIERIRPRFLETDAFLFTYVTEDGMLRPLIIKSKRFAIGSDWGIIDLKNNKEIAHVDGKVLDIGGEWTIKTKEEDEILWRSLIVFASTLRFYDSLKEKLESITKTMKKKKKLPKLDRMDISFFYNPRLRR